MIRGFEGAILCINWCCFEDTNIVSDSKVQDQCNSMMTTYKTIVFAMTTDINQTLSNFLDINSVSSDLSYFTPDMLDWKLFGVSKISNKTVYKELLTGLVAENVQPIPQIESWSRGLFSSLDMSVGLMVGVWAFQAGERSSNLSCV